MLQNQDVSGGQRSGFSGSAEVRGPGAWLDHMLSTHNPPCPTCPIPLSSQKESNRSFRAPGGHTLKCPRNRYTAIRIRKHSICPKYNFSQHLFTEQCTSHIQYLIRYNNTKKMILKRMKLTPLAATWVDLESLILRDVKDKYYMLLLLCGI